MPTVLTVGPYKFVFFSSDRAEPVDVYGKRDRRAAKFWLEPIGLAKNLGLPDHEVNRIERLVAEYQEFLI